MVNLKLPRFTVTHIPGTRSSRVVQVLEELSLPYVIKERVKPLPLRFNHVLVRFSTMKLH